ncbi:S9 family peptidase [Fodinicola acaciae]|uniref:S9 family peptidase n=1 Tax=Fodinicola acaciae TaxID=2681555 RepID=UPI0013D69C85|nr:S9 family peptidase [Fodinicola acaciae]
MNEPTAPERPGTTVPPPVAKRVPSTRTHHGDTVIDEYAWLAAKDDPDTLAYLHAENAYAEQLTAGLADLRERIFTEIKDRTQETDLSVPARKGDWWYYSRTVEGQQYSIHCRAAVTGDEPPATGEAVDGEQVLLDENELAEGHDFLSVGTFDVSPDGRLLAYAVDFDGNERFTLRVKDLETGELLGDEVPDTFYDTAWSLDSSVLYYLTVDDAWRPYRVWRHRIGTPAAEDTVVYEEADERFWVGIGLTRSERYVLIDLRSKITSETRLLDAGDPAAEPVVLRGRRQGVEYSVDHQIAGDRFLIVHNDPECGGGPNFAVAAAPADKPEAWTPLVEHREDTRLLDLDVFENHVVVHLRHDALTGLRVYPVEVDGGLAEPRPITFPEPLYTVGVDTNLEYRTGTFRLSYGSLVTPRTVYDCDLTTGELTLRKQQPVLGGYDPERYEQSREWATADDGTRVPLSIVRRKGVPLDGSAPCLIYGYGSYESSMDPRMAVPRLSLLDRGFVYAIAHIRGGGELGRHWYEDGKLLKKKNTFTDFVACARYLVERGWTSQDRLVAYGGSAGGLLMGAVANLAPEAFGAIVASVPFVDALNSILDPSLPLTVLEWEEWGDPLHDPEVYAYMKSYSPYENVRATDYPAIFVETSLNDTRVLYHEPAKWVARLRAVNSENAGAKPVVMHIEMEAGHGGRSGRYDAWREIARMYAWIIDIAGAPHEPLG